MSQFEFCCGNLAGSVLGRKANGLFHGCNLHQSSPETRKDFGIDSMWRGLQILFGLLNVAVIVMACYFLLHGGVASIQNHQVVEYKDFVSILLMAIAVMIAVLTIFVAAAAFWGFNSLKDEACRIARLEANQTAARVATSLHEQRNVRNNVADLGAAAAEDEP